MVSFQQLKDADVKGLDTAWRSWRKTVELLERAEDGYRGKLLAGISGARWRGDDADSARTMMVPVQQRFKVASAQSSSVASVINSAVPRFTAAQKKLLDAISVAQAEYLKVGPDGSLDFPTSLPPRYSSWEEFQKKAQQIQARFVAAVREASAADQEIAAALRRLGADIMAKENPLKELRDESKMATQLAGFNPANIPPRGAKTPRQVADWWKALPEEQRHLLMNAYPEKIGWLNGIPSEDRDEANRTRLQSRVQQLREIPEDQRTDFQKRDLARLEMLDRTIAGYEVKGKDMYLLGLDSTVTGKKETDDGSDGRVIVSIGNPDTAKINSVYVPGTESDLTKANGALSRAFAINEATGLHTQQSVATTMWLGYDAPDDVKWNAGGGHYADQGGPRLNSFLDGVREAQSTEGNQGSRLSLLGHSYGSTVIGEAANAKYRRLPVDDIIVAGSPGMRVSNAEDLGIGASNVWAQAAHDDPVPKIGRIAHGGGLLVPSDDSFGANRLPVGDPDHGQGGHSNYYNQVVGGGNSYSFSGASGSLDQQARVIAGLRR